MNEGNDQLDILLEETKNMYREIYNNSIELDKKSIALMTGSTIILTLSIAIIDLQQTSSSRLIFYILFILITILFTALIVLQLISLLPKKYKMAIIANWEIIESTLLIHCNLSDFKTQLITNYIDRISHNSKINQIKSNYINLGTILFSIIMILTIINGIFFI